MCFDELSYIIVAHVLKSLHQVGDKTPSPGDHGASAHVPSPLTLPSMGRICAFPLANSVHPSGATAGLDGVERASAGPPHGVHLALLWRRLHLQRAAAAGAAAGGGHTTRMGSRNFGTHHTVSSFLSWWPPIGGKLLEVFVTHP